MRTVLRLYSAPKRLLRFAWLPLRHNDGFHLPERCIIYIIRRTQLYLDEQLWGALHARARSERTTVSELVRQAVRERYFGDLDRRRAAMQSFVGIRTANSEGQDARLEVRHLRRGGRLDRLGER